MDHVISEMCYKGTILQRNYRKMTILWSFFYSYFVNSMVKKHGSHNMTVLDPKPCYNEVIKGLHYNIRSTKLLLFVVKVNKYKFNNGLIHSEIDSFYIVSADAPNCLVSRYLREINLKGHSLYGCLYFTLWNMEKDEKKKKYQIKIRLIVKVNDKYIPDSIRPSREKTCLAGF